MSNPVLIPCPKDQWTLVSTNVTTGQINKKSDEPNLYLHTYRDTGSAAPTLIDEGVKMFINSEITEQISSSTGIDIYIWTTENDGVVRVDL